MGDVELAANAILLNLHGAMVNMVRIAFGNRKDVERQWAEKPALSAFKAKKEVVGLLKRQDNILTIWKMWNDTTEDEILGLLGFEIENDEIKVCRYNVT